MHKYGRIEPQQVEALLSAEMNGQIYLPCYRGASHLNPQQQVAEVAVRVWLQDQQGITEPVQIRIIEQQSERIVIFWRTARCRGSVAVSGYQENVERYDTCAEIDAGESPTVQPVWRVSGVQVIDPSARWLEVEENG